MENQNNTMKSVCYLIKHMMEGKYYDIKRLNEVAPKQVMEGLNDSQKVNRLVQALNLETLVRNMGLDGYEKINEGVMNPEWFRWSR